MMEAIKQVRGRAVVIPGDEIDTDRIVPARFLKAVTFDGLGEALFYDERYDEAGNPKDHPLNRPERRGARVLVVGAGFGSGSSREHAPQAIKRAGFQAIIGESFAEIFFGNATQIGLVCVTLDPEDLGVLAEWVEAHPEGEVEVDLEAREVRFGGRVAPLAIREAAREALVSGRWDPLAELLEAMDEIKKLDAARPGPGKRGGYRGRA
ncbi:3-isopropylmalate dehydratase small subunit [Oceanithermus profundus]